MLFVFVFAIKSLLVCYCACSLSLNIFALKEIIYRNKEIKISSTDINMTNPEEGRNWFSRSVASMTNICSWGTHFIIVPVLVCVTKIIKLKYWRHISLLCLDAKTNTIKQTKKYLTNNHISRIPQRTIFNNLFLVRDIIKLTKKKTPNYISYK